MIGIRPWITAFAVTAAMATSSLAQRGVYNSHGQPVGLLSDPQVRQELKLDAEQIKKAEAATESWVKKNREIAQAARAAEQTNPGAGIEAMKLEGAANAAEYKEQLASFLKPEQSKRLREITIQRYRWRIFLDSDLRKDLKVSREQDAQMDEILNAMQKRMREVSRQFSIPEKRQAAMAEAQEMNTKVEADLVAVLDEGQKKRWAEMEGPPFPIAPQARP